MNDYICDDGIDYIELGNRINAMTDEEFEAYCEKLKREEVLNDKKHPE